ncbi:uncharacterized protein LOC123499995 [Portunus trituberculatus]|uniref:uncharacterized protein LOC123499995 n=1 Tax=Portunus trituberculatus TaxID=210409 RepID=UPI001E1CFB4B|nr:uncharacterized protein LOC123499995 [Portunus trituberculatus]
MSTTSAISPSSSIQPEITFRWCRTVRCQAREVWLVLTSVTGTQVCLTWQQHLGWYEAPPTPVPCGLHTGFIHVRGKGEREWPVDAFHVSPHRAAVELFVAGDPAGAFLGHVPDLRRRYLHPSPNARRWVSSTALPSGAGPSPPPSARDEWGDAPRVRSGRGGLTRGGASASLGDLRPLPAATPSPAFSRAFRVAADLSRTSSRLLAGLSSGSSGVCVAGDEASTPPHHGIHHLLHHHPSSSTSPSPDSEDAVSEPRDRVSRRRRRRVQGEVSCEEVEVEAALSAARTSSLRTEAALLRLDALAQERRVARLLAQSESDSDFEEEEEEAGVGSGDGGGGGGGGGRGRGGGGQYGCVITFESRSSSLQDVGSPRALEDALVSLTSTDSHPEFTFEGSRSSGPPSLSGQAAGVRVILEPPTPAPRRQAWTASASPDLAEDDNFLYESLSHDEQRVPLLLAGLDSEDSMDSPRRRPAPPSPTPSPLSPPRPSPPDSAASGTSGHYSPHAVSPPSPFPLESDDAQSPPLVSLESYEPTVREVVAVPPPQELRAADHGVLKANTPAVTAETESAAADGSTQAVGRGAALVDSGEDNDDDDGADATAKDEATIAITTTTNQPHHDTTTTLPSTEQQWDSTTTTTTTTTMEAATDHRGAAATSPADGEGDHVTTTPQPPTDGRDTTTTTMVPLDPPAGSGGADLGHGGGGGKSENGEEQKERRGRQSGSEDGGGGRGGGRDGQGGGGGGGRESRHSGARAGRRGGEHLGVHNAFTQTPAIPRTSQGTSTTTARGTPADRHATERDTPADRHTTARGTPADRHATERDTPADRHTTARGTPADRHATERDTPADRHTTARGAPPESHSIARITPAERHTTIRSTPADWHTTASPSASPPRSPTRHPRPRPRVHEASYTPLPDRLSGPWSQRSRLTPAPPAFLSHSPARSVLATLQQSLYTKILQRASPQDTTQMLHSSLRLRDHAPPHHNHHHHLYHTLPHYQYKRPPPPSPPASPPRPYRHPVLRPESVLSSSCLASATQHHLGGSTGDIQGHHHHSAHSYIPAPRNTHQHPRTLLQHPSVCSLRERRWSSWRGGVEDSDSGGSTDSLIDEAENMTTSASAPLDFFIGPRTYELSEERRYRRRYKRQTRRRTRSHQGIFTSLRTDTTATAASATVPPGGGAGRPYLPYRGDQLSPGQQVKVLAPGGGVAVARVVTYQRGGQTAKIHHHHHHLEADDTVTVVLMCEPNRLQGSVVTVPLEKVLLAWPRP